MKFDIPDGFVVVPLRGDGSPVGIALWCETPAQCEEVFNQEGGGDGNAYLTSCWRSSEVRAAPATAVAAAQPATAVAKGKARHRGED